MQGVHEQEQDDRRDAEVQVQGGDSPEEEQADVDILAVSAQLPVQILGRNHQEEGIGAGFCIDFIKGEKGGVGGERVKGRCSWWQQGKDAACDGDWVEGRQGR